MEKRDYIEQGGYIEAIGRRKTAVARVRIMKTGKKGILVNKKDINEFFPTKEHVKTVITPFSESDSEFNVTVLVKGGGVSAQAEAIRHGITRALVIFDETNRKKFKSLGLLTRDPRSKERKKFGLKKARRAPQWSKR